jgi:hypothetical protein
MANQLRVLSDDRIYEYDGRHCGPCSWCCECYSVFVPYQEPDGWLTVGEKPAGRLCHWRNGSGCVIHGSALLYPEACAEYVCPYVCSITGQARVSLWNEQEFLYRLIRPDLVIARLRMIQQRLPEAADWVMPKAPAVPEQLGLDAIEQMAVKTRTTLAASLSTSQSGWVVGLWRLDRSIEVSAVPKIWIDWWQPLLTSTGAGQTQPCMEEEESQMR